MKTKAKPRVRGGAETIIKLKSELRSTIASEKSQSKDDVPLDYEQMFSNMQVQLMGILTLGMVRGIKQAVQPPAAELVEMMKFRHFERGAMTVELPRGKSKIHPVLLDELENIAAANGYPVDRVIPIPSTQSGGPPQVLPMLRGRDVKALSPTFFVDPYLPDASLSILFGDPGTSKSLLALWILANVSRGSEVFGCKTKAANVMMLSNEDEPGISMARYRAMGGDAGRISLEDFTGQTFALEHIERLKETVRHYKPKILVIDSVMSHIGGKADVYRQNEVSALLGPLQAIAQELRVVVIGLMHMNKQDAAKAIYRVSGSIGFVGSARSALFLDFKPDEPNARILCHVKANYSAHGPSQEIQVVSNTNGIGRVHWVGTSELKANDLLAKSDNESGGKKLREAADFLNDVLVDGGVPASEIYAGADERGITRRTLERAKKKLGVQSQRSEDNSHSIWFKPEKSKNRVGDV